jgi:hypothetical protein
MLQAMLLLLLLPVLLLPILLIIITLIITTLILPVVVIAPRLQLVHTSMLRVARRSNCAPGIGPRVGVGERASPTAAGLGPRGNPSRGPRAREWHRAQQFRRRGARRLEGAGDNLI